MVSKRTILIATTNPGKLREVRAILAGLPIRLETLADHPPFPEPKEDADTFEGNARLKALYYARLARRLTLADDSGIEVDALDGGPGVHSSRYAGPQCNATANNAKLIEELADVPLARRTARYRCVMALASESEVVTTTSGKWEGLIVDEPRGGHGFGYDPHFLVPECGITAAEMAPDEKNRRSHRGEALVAIRSEIERILAGTP